MKLIDKDAIVEEIERRKQVSLGWMETAPNDAVEAEFELCDDILSFINTLEMKEVDLIIHTIIAECCDWLAMNTNLSHDEIEDCRNLMLIVKEEQFKAQKGEDI